MTKKTNADSGVFNPIKESVDGKLAHKVVWSTKSLELAIEGLNQGKKLVANPFYEYNTKILKGDLVFRRTPEEEQEFLKCMNDIVYFANEYCKLMTPEGIKKVSMREYQRDYLKHLSEHQLSIFLSARQSGKCLIINELVNVRLTTEAKQHIGWNVVEKYRVPGKTDEFEMPLYELVFAEKGECWRQQYELYKELDLHPEKADKIYKELEVLDSGIPEDSEKLIWSHILQGVQIKSESGWSPAAYIHITKPFTIYRLTLESGTTLECADEHLVYCQDMETKYVKDLTEKDLVMTSIYGLDRVKSVEVLPYKVSMCDVTALNDNESYYTNGILSHNTTTSAIFMLHYILFNIDKNTLVLGSTRLVAVEILDKLKKIFYEIPFFLKPGVHKWNESEIALDNGCRCMAQATTINSGISFTFHCVLADEFAHIAPNILDKFYTQIFPTIVAGKAKFIISSTQNGFNLFQKLYTAAEDGENDYAPFRVDWWQVPEWNPDTHTWDKRDENWHRKQAANLGGEENFQAQFGTKFMMQANSLIDQRILTDKMASQEAHLFENKYMPGVSGSQFYFWRKDFEPTEDLRKYRIVVTIDIAEGIGRDHTVFVFNRVLDLERTETVGIFDCNCLNPQQAAISLCECVDHFSDFERTLLSIELNTYGDLFVRYILDMIEKQKVRFDEDIILKYQSKNSNQYKNGIKMTPNNKPVFCTVFKQKFEDGSLKNVAKQFLRQAENFADIKGNGSYQAMVGHDDIMMAQIQLVAAQETLRYRYLAEDAEAESTDKNYNYFDFGMQQNPWLRSAMQDSMWSGIPDESKTSALDRLRMF